MLVFVLYVLMLNFSLCMFAKNADLVNIFSSNSILKKHSGKNLWNYFDVSETYGSGYPLYFDN